METKQITVYDIEELTGKARERALDWLREGLDYEWWDCTYEDAKKCADCIGIEIDKIYFSGFWSQGDGACFKGKYAYRKGWKKALKGYAPMDKELLKIGQALQDLQKPLFYNAQCDISCNDRYFRTSADFYWNDPTPEDIQEDFSQLFTDFASWIYEQLAKEYDWLSSEKQLIETAQANGYQFDEYGRIL